MLMYNRLSFLSQQKLKKMVRSDTGKKTFYQNQTEVFFHMMMTKCHTTVENDK